jgi:hypothetical protein
MYRLNSRSKAGALSVLAVAIGTLLITAAPAKADHFGIIFAPPFPLPFPAVVVEHEVNYGPPHVVYERPYRVYQSYPAYYGHRPHQHSRDCEHRGHADWDRGGWHGDDHGDRYYERRDVDYRGRY